MRIVDESWVMDNLRVSISPAPEPEVYAMFMAGLGLMRLRSIPLSAAYCSAILTSLGSGLVSSPRTGPPSSGVRPPLEYFPLPFPVPLVPISAIDSLRRLFASSRNLLFRFSRDVRPAAVDSLSVS